MFKQLNKVHIYSTMKVMSFNYSKMWTYGNGTGILLLKLWLFQESLLSLHGGFGFPILDVSTCVMRNSQLWIPTCVVWCLKVVAAGSVTVAYPFDTVRRRLMMMSGEGDKMYRYVCGGYWTLALSTWVWGSVADPERFDADPDPTFFYWCGSGSHFLIDADPDPTF